LDYNDSITASKRELDAIADSRERTMRAALRRSALQEIAKANQKDFEGTRYEKVRASTAYRKWSRAIIDLAKGRCQCTVGCENEATEVHHINYDFGMIAPRFIGIAICRPCHVRLTNGWDGWEVMATDEVRIRPANDTRQVAMDLAGDD
jgi:hypothetical protein